EILETVDRIALSDVPILVRGETGVGKEVLAELVHEKSDRRANSLVKVNCAALPEPLLESELFGYEKGAFTGADRRKPGRFELAHGGTLFLDEIGEIPPSTQVKLLRVLQDHLVERLGATAPVPVDVRVIAATNVDLPAAIRGGRFREDLYFRLNVVSLVIPPLRARKEEIPDLVDRFVSSYTRSNETKGQRIGPAAMDRLFQHDWPGNVRELRNTIERALVIARGEEVQADEIVFPEAAGDADAAPAGKPYPVAGSPPPASVPDHPALNDRQRKLMEILSTRDSITNREYSAIVGVSVRTGNRDMVELIAYGLIEQVGKRRGAVYRLRGS
ncbi:MAG: sigma 54-interacting transcriptional regulator, partial [Planctomycetota bacterium]